MVWVCGSPVLAVLIFLLVPLGISWNHSIVETIHFDMSICKIIQLWSCYQLAIFKGGLYVTLIFSLSSLVCGSKIEEHENMCQLQYISRSNVNYWNWFSNIQHYFSSKSNIQILVLIPVKNSNIGRRLQMGESQSFFSLHSFFFPAPHRDYKNALWSGCGEAGYTNIDFDSSRTTYATFLPLWWNQGKHLISAMILTFECVPNQCNAPFKFSKWTFHNFKNVS